MTPRAHRCADLVTRLEDERLEAALEQMGGGGEPDRAVPVIQCCAPLGGDALTDHEAAQIERVFKALADRQRVKILNRLLAAGDQAVCVCDLEDLLGLKQPTVSYHLKQLLTAGIIMREKRGSYAYFSLAPDGLERVRELLAPPVAAAAV